MDLKPSPALIDQFQRMSESEAVKNEKEEGIRQATLERLELLEPAIDFEKKLKSLHFSKDPYAGEEGTGWHTIKVDEETGLAIQAQAGHYFRNSENVPDWGYEIGQDRYTLSIRYMDGEGRAAGEGLIAAANRTFNERETQRHYIDCVDAKGLRPGQIDLDASEPVDGEQIRQIQEITAEVLDPLLAVAPLRRSGR